MENYDITALSFQRRRTETARSSLNAGLPVAPDLEHYVQAFTPRWSQPDLDIWHAVFADLVKEWVTVAGPPSEAVALRMLSVTAAFCLWAYKSHGSISPKTLWDPKAIEHFIFGVNKSNSDSWKAAARSNLRRLGPIVNPNGIWAHSPTEISRGPVKPPYSESEQNAFLQAVNHSVRPDPLPQLFVYAAGFGAGLGSSDMPLIRSEHISEIVPGKLAIVVLAAGRERTAFVLNGVYEDMKFAVRYSYKEYMLGSDPRQRGAVSKVASSIEVTGIGTLSVSRMRSTWICHHLRNGTPLLLLLEMAGLTSANTILQLAKYVGISDREGAIAKALEAT